jgi:hypothetical protein
MWPFGASRGPCLWPSFGSPRSHVAIWPFSEPCGHLALRGQLSASTKLLLADKVFVLKCDFLAWAGTGPSKDFIRPDGHMAPERARWPSTPPPKGPDGHVAHQTARWPHMASQRARWAHGPAKGQMATWRLKGQMATWLLKGPHGHMTIQRARWPHGAKNSRCAHGP